MLLLLLAVIPRGLMTPTASIPARRVAMSRSIRPLTFLLIGSSSVVSGPLSVVGTQSPGGGHQLTTDD